jgi:hypothetical protein
MKKIGTLTALISVFSFIFVTQSLARGIMWRGGGGWGMGSAYARLYNPKTVETITGEMVSVDRITPMKGMSYGVHLMVKTDKETMSFQLGPEWYIENQDIKIEPGDKVEVTGSRVTFQGKPAIIPAQVKKRGRSTDSPERSRFSRLERLETGIGSDVDHRNQTRLITADLMLHCGDQPFTHQFQKIPFRSRYERHTLYGTSFFRSAT